LVAALAALRRAVSGGRLSFKSLAFPLLVLVLYAWLFPWIPALRSPNELSRLYQARAIVEDHSFSVNRQFARHGPVGDLSVKDGRYYPNKAPGVSFLGAAALAAVRAARGFPVLSRAPDEGRDGDAVPEAAAVFWLRLFVCMLPGAAAAELLRRILARRFEPALATSGAIVFALGTIMWPYSTFLMSHGPAAASVVACWWAIEKARATRGWRWWTLAGFIGGWAVLLEYTSALALPPLLVFLGCRSRPRHGGGGQAPALRDLLGSGIHPPAESSPAGDGLSPRGTVSQRRPVDVILQRHRRCELMSGALRRLKRRGELSPRAPHLERQFMWHALSPARGRGRQGRRRHRRGAPAAVLAIALGFLPPLLALALYHQAAFGNPFHTGYRHLVNPVFTEWHARGFMGVGAPSLRALAGSLLDPARGLFSWSPFLALGVPGLVPLWHRDRPLALLCAAELGLYTLFTASFTYQAWGWSVGPRHITTACAFLVPPALAAAEWLRDRGFGFVAAGLALSGMALLALTVAVCPYLPDELTNPVWQLVLPLARRGLRSPDVLGMALHASSGVTLLPWLALLLVAAVWASIQLSRRQGERSRPRRTLFAVLLAVLLAVGLFAARSWLGGPDHFEPTRRFMESRIVAGGR
jgi:hypothetical protein